MDGGSYQWSGFLRLVQRVHESALAKFILDTNYGAKFRSQRLIRLLARLEDVLTDG